MQLSSMHYFGQKAEDNLFYSPCKQLIREIASFPVLHLLFTNSFHSFTLAVSLRSLGSFSTSKVLLYAHHGLGLFSFFGCTYSIILEKLCAIHWALYVLKWQQVCNAGANWGRFSYVIFKVHCVFMFLLFLHLLLLLYKEGSLNWPKRVLTFYTDHGFIVNFFYHISFSAS